MPKAQTLTSDAKEALAAIAEGPAEAHKIRKLLLDRPIVQYLLEGGLVYVEFEDWVNKSLGRSEIKVFFAERENYTWKYWFTGMDVFGLIGKLFPWADYVLDEEYYSLHCEYSGEDLEIVKRRHGDIYPFEDAMGEVERYRVRLIPNDFGEGLRKLFEYIESSS